MILFLLSAHLLAFDMQVAETLDWHHRYYHNFEVPTTREWDKIPETEAEAPRTESSTVRA